MADTLRINDDVMLLAALPVFDYPVNQRLLIAVIALRNDDVLRAVCNTSP